MARNKPVKYRISFCPPGRTRDPTDFDAPTPFQRTSVGDELAGIMFGGCPNVSVACVTRVVRSVWDPGGGEIHDVTPVFSEPIAEKEEMADIGYVTPLR